MYYVYKAVKLMECLNGMLSLTKCSYRRSGYEWVFCMDRFVFVDFTENRTLATKPLFLQIFLKDQLLTDGAVNDKRSEKLKLCRIKQYSS